MKKTIILLFLILLFSSTFALSDFNFINMTPSTANSNQDFQLIVKVLDENGNNVPDANVFSNFQSDPNGGFLTGFSAGGWSSNFGAIFSTSDNNTTPYFRITGSVPTQSILFDNEGMMVAWNDQDQIITDLSSGFAGVDLGTDVVFADPITGVPTKGGVAILVYPTELSDSITGINLTLFGTLGDGFSFTFSGKTDEQINGIDGSFQLHEGKSTMISFDLTQPISNINGNSFNWGNVDNAIIDVISSNSNIDGTMELTFIDMSATRGKSVNISNMYYDSGSQTYKSLKNIRTNGNYFYDFQAFKSGFNDQLSTSVGSILLSTAPPSTPSFTVDTTKVSDIANNSLSLIEGLTVGFNANSSGIGGISGIVIEAILILALLGTITVGLYAVIKNKVRSV